MVESFQIAMAGSILAIALCTLIIHFGLRLFGQRLPIKASFQVAWVTQITSALLTVAAAWIFHKDILIDLAIILLFGLWFGAAVIRYVVRTKGQTIEAWRSYLLSFACVVAFVVAGCIVIGPFVDG